jgi:hypothetical protein
MISSLIKFIGGEELLEVGGLETFPGEKSLIFFIEKTPPLNNSAIILVCGKIPPEIHKLEDSYLLTLNPRAYARVYYGIPVLERGKMVEGIPLCFDIPRTSARYRGALMGPFRAKQLLKTRIENVSISQEDLGDLFDAEHFYIGRENCLKGIELFLTRALETAREKYGLFVPS